MLHADGLDRTLDCSKVSFPGARKQPQMGCSAHQDRLFNRELEYGLVPLGDEPDVLSPLAS
jgi:hypothetical protein